MALSDNDALDNDYSDNNDCFMDTCALDVDEDSRVWIIAYEEEALLKRHRGPYDGTSRTSKWRKSKLNSEAAQRTYFSLNIYPTSCRLPRHPLFHCIESTKPSP